MISLYLISALSLGIICIIGIVSDKFKDNLIQRIAMSFMVLSCGGFVSQLLQNTIPHDFEIFLVSVSVYAMATTWKYRHG